MATLKSIPDSYTACEKFMGKETVKQICYKTKMYKYNDGENIWYALHYIKTIIVRYYKNGIVLLNNGGWKTRTTQYRINRVIRRLSTREYGGYIQSKKGVWIVVEFGPTEQNGKEYPFFNGYELYIGDLDETTGRRFRNPSEERKGNDKVLPQT